MNSARVLVLHGSPGSGKTTLAREIAQLLGAGGVPHGVIDVDELNLVWPPPAPVEILKARVAEREPTDELRESLRAWVDHHAARTHLDGIRDVLVSTHERSEADAAREVMRAIGWSA